MAPVADGILKPGVLAPMSSYDEIPGHAAGGVDRCLTHWPVVVYAPFTGKKPPPAIRGECSTMTWSRWCARPPAYSHWPSECERTAHCRSPWHEDSDEDGADFGPACELTAGARVARRGRASASGRAQAWGRVVFAGVDILGAPRRYGRLSLRSAAKPTERTLERTTIAPRGPAGPAAAQRNGRESHRQGTRGHGHPPSGAQNRRTEDSGTPAGSRDSETARVPQTRRGRSQGGRIPRRRRVGAS